MSDFPFKVGDKVRRELWGPAEHVTITAVGSKAFLGVYPGDDDAYECRWDMISYDSGPWEAYGPPVKRYVVELRPPKDGEQYVYVDAGAVAPYDFETNRFVIVEELS